MSVLQEAYQDSSDDPIYTYELDAAEVAKLSEELLLELGDKIPSNLPYVCVQLDGASPFSNLARTLEATVFDHDLNDNVQDVKEDYKDYETSSFFYVIMDISKKTPVGTMRIIQNGPAGLQTLNTLSGEPYYIPQGAVESDYRVDINKTWDIGTIAISEEYRRGDTPESIQANYFVSGLLYRALLKGLNEADADAFISMIDVTDPKRNTLRKLRSIGIPFADIYDAPPKAYSNGKEYQPVIAYLADVVGSMTQHAESELAIAKETGDERLISKAETKKYMVNEILTGSILDAMMVKR